MMMMRNGWFVYMIYSVTLDRLYTGITMDPDVRLGRHNAGKGAKATRAGRPWRLVYTYGGKNSSGVSLTKGEALKEEARIKKLSRAEKERLINE